MSEPLRAFMVRLASDPERLSAFIADPERAMNEAGLSDEERQLVRSGDQNRLYAALASRPAVHAAASAPPAPAPADPPGVILVPVRSPFGAAVIPVPWSPAEPTRTSETRVTEGGGRGV